MDCEKLYKEALERAKTLQKTCDSLAVVGWCEYLFPELKESEDEKIRKALIDYFDDANKSDENPLQSYGIQTDEVIAWLEKQGEPNPYSGVSFKYDGHTWGMCARDGGVHILIDSNLKAFVSLDKSFIYPIHPQPIIVPQPAREADEEKVDNQICMKGDDPKPEFKVGDWITFYGGKPLKIIKTAREQNGKLDYLLLDTSGHDNYYNKKYVDKNASLWTIKDAKDSDVLVDVYGNIGIYQRHDDFDWTSYCFSWKSGSFHHFKGDHENEKTYPATKEQRDILMRAMTDAGWEFNFEKKELKRIEQKPVSITDEWIEDYWRHHKVINPYSYDKGEEIQFDHQGFVRFCKKYCRKSAWSEEDERICQCLIKDQEESLDNVRNDRYGHSEIISDLKEMYAERIAWLKSLKDRYTWKPSDEQMKALEHFVRSIGESGYASPYDNNTKLLYLLLEQLKKLK